MTNIKKHLPELCDFSKSVLLYGLFISITIFAFAFASTMMYEISDEITQYTVDIFATAGLKTIVMSTFCALMTDYIIKSREQKEDE